MREGRQRAVCGRSRQRGRGSLHGKTALGVQINYLRKLPKRVQKQAALREISKLISGVSEAQQNGVPGINSTGSDRPPPQTPAHGSERDGWPRSQSAWIHDVDGGGAVRRAAPAAAQPMITAITLPRTKSTCTTFTPRFYICSASTTRSLLVNTPVAVSD